MNIKNICPDYDFEIYAPSYIGSPQDNSVMYLTKKIESQMEHLKGHKYCLVFVENNVIITKGLDKDNCFISTATPAFEYTKIVQLLVADRENIVMKKKYQITPDLYYIGENVSVGTGTRIEPGCFIGHDVVIGNNCTIMSGARITNCVIEDDVVIKQNAVIGSWGFAMTQDEQGNNMRIPCFGRVLIRHHVEIGALTSIYQGVAGDTIIEEYVKIDDHVLVGHDAKISRNCEIAGKGAVGAFSEIGEGTFIGINAITKNRIVVGEKCFLGMGSVCVRDVPPFSRMFGNPARVMIVPKT